MPLIQKPSVYLNNKNMRLNTRFIVRGNGERVYVLKDTEIEEAEFLRLFPLGDKIKVLNDSQHKGDNIGSAAL
jgi:hypothetical protein